MERLVELSDQEVRIDFTLNAKCRANVGLRSLVAAAPIAFKVQTSSPHKFLVNPPCGLIGPLAYITFQIILKPQDQLPPTFPRSPADRFLVKTAIAHDFSQVPPDSIHSDLINSWFCSRPRDSFTHDMKLKIAFVGPVLLFHAVGNGDVETAKNLIKRQKTVVAELASREAESLLHVATELSNSDAMIDLLVESGLMIDARDQAGDGDATELHQDEIVVYDGEITQSHRQIQVTGTTMSPERGREVLNAARRGEVNVLESQIQKGYDMKYSDQYGLTPLHVASIKGHKTVVKMLMVRNGGAGIDVEDNEGHSPLHLAVEGGCIETVELLIQHRANVNAKTKRGATPLHIARAMGYDDITDLLLKRGASALHSSSLSMFH